MEIHQIQALAGAALFFFAAMMLVFFARMVKAEPSLANKRPWIIMQIGLYFLALLALACGVLLVT